MKTKRYKNESEKLSLQRDQGKQKKRLWNGSPRGKKKDAKSLSEFWGGTKKKKEERRKNCPVRLRGWWGEEPETGWPSDFGRHIGVESGPGKLEKGWNGWTAEACYLL